MKRIIAPILIAACLVGGTIIARQQAAPDPNRLARLAVSHDPELSAKAITALRAQGPEGLQQFLHTHAATLQAPPKRDAEAWKRLTFALDAIGQQKDCHASKLFWFTDFAKAQNASKQTGKPILSLRLLGKLDEEYSCANSRFFRTTLYPNPAVSEFLRDNFVLHWKSVRPVPRVTIDFGDGRKIERTVTGNSIHYVLAPDGIPIDALPGLYSASTFLSGLSNALTAARTFEATVPEKRSEYLTQYHRERLSALQQEYQGQLAALNLSPTLLPIAAPSAGQQPNAKRAAVFAASKGAIEVPMVAKMVTPDNLLESPLEQQMTDPNWTGLAALHASEAKLDTNSFLLVVSKNPTATAASRFAITKSFNESPLVRVVANLERSIAEDTVRNKYILHRQIHNWFANGSAPADIEQLNRRVYAELFLTPDSDPWLGLVPEGMFSGLQDDGLVKTEN